MNLDFEKLAIEIEAATRKSFQEIVANHAAENIYAFALYSDEGAMTVCPATNTMDFLVTRPQDDLTYYTFEPAEWCYEGSRPGDGFSAISHQLYEAIEAKLKRIRKTNMMTIMTRNSKSFSKPCIKPVLRFYSN